MEKEMNIKSEHPIRIIAKIERSEAVKNIKEIEDFLKTDPENV